LLAYLERDGKVVAELSFDHNAHFVGSLIVLFLTSLTNREAIYHGRWPGRENQTASPGARHVR
jgi:hypothetical protein